MENLLPRAPGLVASACRMGGFFSILAWFGFQVPRIGVRKIRVMMDSCSHTEYQQSFYLPLHSAGMPCSRLFHRPPYLILLLPPPLLLLLVHRLLPENLAMEKRRRVKGNIQRTASVTQTGQSTVLRWGTTMLD